MLPLPDNARLQRFELLARERTGQRVVPAGNRASPHDGISLTGIHCALTYCVPLAE